MLKFITKKIFSALISILILFTLGFVLFRLLPGDPISLVLRDPRFTPEQIESFKKRFGLDKPLWMQYLIYLANAFRGELGISIYTTRPRSHQYLLRDLPTR